MAKPDDTPPVTLTVLTQQLLLLDAMAHHYGRSVPREVRHFEEHVTTADGAYEGLSGVVHRILLRNLRNPEFEAEVHRLIRGWARLNRRHHRRRHSNAPKPPIPTVALAYFIDKHTGNEDASPCFPWWWGAAFKPLADDLVPDLPPYLGKR